MRLGPARARVVPRGLGVGVRRMSQVRVRFAPSPTGFLHVGGLRTALLNFLFARRSGGQFVLRIEDTDRTRLVPGATAALEDALAWAGLTYDEGPSRGGAYGPYVQSERLPIYRRYAERLLERGRAYCDFRPPPPPGASGAADARTSALLREAYLPPSRDEAAARCARGEPHVVRLKMDPTRTFVYDDVVYGRMTFRADVMGGATDDPILVKSDGWPTYHLASVVDDTEMAITHVLRGEEWLPSMPKHLALYEALGVPPPTFVHVPLLVNADGTKLSKRSGDVRVEDYRRAGWEPEALINLVALTGYHHGASDAPDHDVRTMQSLIDHFDIHHIAQARATLPMDKLAYLNRHHLAAKLGRARSGDVTLAADVTRRLRDALAPLHAGADVTDAYLLDAAALDQPRVDKLIDVPAHTAYLFQEPDYGTEACRAFRRTVPTPTFRHVVDELATWLPTARDIPAAFPAWMHAQAKAAQGGKAAVQKSVRLALTGRKAGPPVADIAALLGTARAAERCRRALAWDEAHA